MKSIGTWRCWALLPSLSSLRIGLSALRAIGMGNALHWPLNIAVDQVQPPFDRPSRRRRTSRPWQLRVERPRHINSKTALRLIARANRVVLGETSSVLESEGHGPSQGTQSAGRVGFA